MRVCDEAEGHWDSVSQATQLRARRRSTARHGRRRRRRLRSGLALVRLGLRLAQPLDVAQVVGDSSGVPSRV
jgi:hypothetical protein